MICPIRCYTCGCPIAHLWSKYKERVARGEDSGKVMTELGLERYCCRGIFLGHVDLLQDIAQFKKE